jgi:hypothetical protein
MSSSIGLLSDSHGDLQAFDAGYELLRARGAKRFFFHGGRYADFDEWLHWKRAQARGGREYSDSDFLTDVASFLTSGPAAAKAEAAPTASKDVTIEELNRLPDRFVRTPERDCLQYRDPAISRKTVDMLGDVLCCVVHDKNDLDREDLQNGLVFLHGKTTEPKVVQIGPRYFVTPGALAGAAEQTCGLLELVDRNLRFSAFTLDGKVLVDNQILAMGSKTKLSVK